MPSCAVKCCKNTSRNKKTILRDVTYHVFPKDNKWKKLWVEAIKREDWFPNNRSTICSEHFEDKFVDNSKKRRRLSPEAIPTLKLKEEHVEEPKGDMDCDLPRILSTANLELTPRKKRLISHIEYITQSNKMKQIKIKRLQMRQRRLFKKVQKLEDIIDELKEKFSISDNYVDLLKTIGGACSELIHRRFLKQSESSLPKKYSEELRAFAITLHYISPKAYNYVRKVFSCCLPHENTISNWYKNIDGNPGLTQESFMAIKEKVKTTNCDLICALVVDEMAIRQDIQYDGNKFHGYVSLGGEVDTDFLEEAKDAFVLLLVAINSEWKIPLGYYLVNGLDGEQRANIVQQCLIQLKDTGIKVVSLTFDGCPANIKMANTLGCNISSDNMITTFVDTGTQKEIAVFLDPCHCLKLIRNTFQAKQVIYDENNKKIQWKYLECLEKLQTEEALVLGNKLRLSHIKFQNNIMKVKLASQLFSRSVSIALNFCANQLNIPLFDDVSGTCRFLDILNDLFDILNSRNILQKGYKQPLNRNNFHSFLIFLNSTEKYLSTLYTIESKVDKKQKKVITQHVKLYQSQRKTGFLGFLVCIQSLKFLYRKLIVEDKVLKHIPSYKMSQDHIEMFFSIIRAKGGFNNNPTALQFRSAYKKLLVRMELFNISSGNCYPQQNISILTCSSVLHSVSVLNSSSQRNRIDFQQEDDSFIDEHNVMGNILSEYSLNVVTYIAGFVVKKIIAKISCEDCVSACIATPEFRDSNVYNSFIKIKDVGGLTFPSQDVVQICTKTEQYLRSFIVLNSVKSSFNKMNFVNKLMRHFVGSCIFRNLNNHQFDQDPLHNHIYSLTKVVIQIYLNIRIHFICKNMNSQLSNRQQFTKTILFRGQ